MMSLEPLLTAVWSFVPYEPFVHEDVLREGLHMGRRKMSLMRLKVLPASQRTLACRAVISRAIVSGRLYNSAGLDPLMPL